MHNLATPAEWKLERYALKFCFCWNAARVCFFRQLRTIDSVFSNNKNNRKTNKTTLWFSWDHRFLRIKRKHMDTGFEKSCTFANKRFKTMRTLFSLLLFLLISINGFAQFFNQYNSASRTAIIEYTKDKSGFYQKRSNINVDNVTNIISIYAFDKKKKQIICSNFIWKLCYHTNRK